MIPSPGLRALLIAEAELGERIMRALILRRVALIDSGAGGAVLIGPPTIRRRGAAAEFPRPQRPIRIICSIPRPTREAQDAASHAMHRRRPSCRWSWRPTARFCAIRARRRSARALGMVDACHPSRRSIDVAVVGAGPGRAVHRGLCRLGRAVGRSCSTAAPSAARPAPARASRIISASRPASPAGRWPAAPIVQAQKFGAEMLIPVEVKRSIARREDGNFVHRRSTTATTVRARAVVVASGARYRRPAVDNLDGVRGPRRLVLGLADRGAAVRRRGGGPGRRRQLGRPGGGVSVARMRARCA